MIAVQHKVCDIASSLVDLYARVSTLEGGGDNVEAAKDSVRSALRQWASAWLHVTKQRRRAVIDLVEPSFEFLLAGQDSFAAGAEAREKLFTGKFLESMLKEATQDATLAQKDAVARPAGRAGRPVRGRGRMVREPVVFQQPYQRPGVAGASLAATRRPRFRGARNAGDSWSRIGQRFDKTPIFVPINVCSPDNQVGARLLRFSKNWERITDDRWILESVASGVKFDFLSQPRQNSNPSPIKMSSEMVAVCEQEVRDLI